MTTTQFTYRLPYLAHRYLVAVKQTRHHIRQGKADNAYWWTRRAIRAARELIPSFVSPGSHFHTF